MSMETMSRPSSVYEKAQVELNTDRQITIENMSKDIFKISEALCSIKDLSVEGQIIREDLLGLLEFESDKLHQIDSLMIERRKSEFSGRHFLDSSEQKTIIQ